MRQNYVVNQYYARQDEKFEMLIDGVGLRPSLATDRAERRHGNSLLEQDVDRLKFNP